MRAILHIQTTHSGGTDSVAQALLRARERGHRRVAITDRNTIAGVAEARRIGLRLGLTVIPGVEMDAVDSASGQRVGILGYGFRFPAARIAGLCTAARESGAAAPSPGAAEVIAAIRGDGGLAVLAWAVRPRVAALVDRLASAGLDGVELPAAPEGDGGSMLADAARRCGLLVIGPCDTEALTRLVMRGDEETLWAQSLVREAGRMAREALLCDFDPALKGGNIRDLVTEHDREIDRFLIDSISKRHPDHDFLTEEHEHPAAGTDAPVWIIDPIDGTTNFVTSRDSFAVSVAHYRGGTPVFGIVYDVMGDDLYLGIARGGAYLNGQPFSIADAGGDPESGPEGREKALEEAVVECSFICAHRLAKRFGADTERLATGFRAQRAYGCASLGLCRIARGTLDIYVSCSLASWDYAAAAVVLAEAGGTAAVEAASAGAGPAGSPAGGGLELHSDRRLVVAAADARTVSRFCHAVFPGDKPQLRSL